MRSENSNIQIKQELVNSIVHGFGIIFGVVSILIALAIKSENMAGIVSRSIWLCFLQLFTFSTLYHGIQHTSKTHLKSLITSVFISAGTYTVLLMYMLNFWYYVAIGFVTVLGIIYTIFFRKVEGFSTLIYIGMGCIMVVAGGHSLRVFLLISSQ
jgi:hemolysin III